MRPPLLSPSELCDVLNYVLGLPEIVGKKTVLRPTIPTLVVSIWLKKPTRLHVELWLDGQLRNAGLGPKPLTDNTPRPRLHKFVPKELYPWVPKPWRNA